MNRHLESCEQRAAMQAETGGHQKNAEYQDITWGDDGSGEVDAAESLVLLW
jgi:hypothetical protein